MKNVSMGARRRNGVLVLLNLGGLLRRYRLGTEESARMVVPPP